MELFKILIIETMSVAFGEYVLVEQPTTWHEAQNYCQRKYTNLVSISNGADEAKLREIAAEKQVYKTWIGLYRNPENATGWRWSGGGYSTYFNWMNLQPNYLQEQFFVSACWTKCSGWNDLPSTYLRPFFCLNLIVVREEKTWEEALEHCREHHTDLTSLVSETEVLLAQREIQETQTTDRVWIGLSYLGNRWLWVNGDPLEYEAWTQGGDQHMCPRWSHSCGALTKEGLWENHYCQEKLNFICD